LQQQLQSQGEASTQRLKQQKLRLEKEGKRQKAQLEAQHTEQLRRQQAAHARDMRALQQQLQRTLAENARLERELAAVEMPQPDAEEDIKGAQALMQLRQMGA
jgi:hypothetical protein